MRTSLHCIFTVATTAGALLLGSLPAAVHADILYVSNRDNNTIEKFTANGVGSIFADGRVTGELSAPVGLAFDSMGNLYAANNFPGGSIEKFSPSGTGSLFAGGLSNPTGLAFDTAGNLYARNASSNQIVRFTPLGVGSVFATGISSNGLAFDSAGNLYASNALNPNTIIKIAPDGTRSVFASAGLSGPQGLAFDSAGNLFVANFSNNTIEKFTPEGVGSLFASTGLARPRGLAFDSAGNLYVANEQSWTIVKFTPGGIGSVFADGFDGLTAPNYLAFTDDNGVPLPLANQRVVPEPGTWVTGVALCIPALLGFSRPRRFPA